MERQVTMDILLKETVVLFPLLSPCQGVPTHLAGRKKHLERARSGSGCEREGQDLIVTAH